MVNDLLLTIEGTKRLRQLKKMFRTWHEKSIPRLQRMNKAQVRMERAVCDTLTYVILDNL